MPRELLVVMPVFNEEACVERVLDEWAGELDRAGIDYGLLLLDDGSRDRTPAILEKWKLSREDDRVEIVSRANRGHGQTCLEGYRRACRSGAAWVFQIDSDAQCDPSYFREVWTKREGNDVVYGHRAERRDGWKRVLSSALVRLVVRATSGVDCIDANVPYRLMAAARLLPLIESIPAQFDLANIALAVQLKRAGWREAVVPIVFRPRAGGEPSVPVARFAGKAVQLFVQLLFLPAPGARGTK